MLSHKNAEIMNAKKAELMSQWERRLRYRKKPAVDIASGGKRRKYAVENQTGNEPEGICGRNTRQAAQLSGTAVTIATAVRKTAISSSGRTISERRLPILNSVLVHAVFIG